MARRKTQPARVDPTLDGRVLDALIIRLRAQKNTQALGDLADETRSMLHRVARWAGLWTAEDRGKLLAEVTAQITAPRRGAKSPSHLVEFRRRWDMTTGCVKGVQATVTRPGTPYRELGQIWRHILGQRQPLEKSVLDRAWYGDRGRGRAPRVIAWRLLLETPDVREFTREDRRKPIDPDNGRPGGPVDGRGRGVRLAPDSARAPDRLVADPRGEWERPTPRGRSPRMAARPGPVQVTWEFPTGDAEARAQVGRRALPETQAVS